MVVLGLRSWIVKKFALDKEVRQLVAEEFRTEFNGILKSEVVALLSDEEVATLVTGYGDALYDRYQKKFWGQIGGIQKGLNNLPNTANPDMINSLISGLDGEDGLSLSSLIKMFLAQGLSGKKSSNIMNVGEMT